MTVEYQAEIESPNKHIGYLIDGVINVPLAEGNRYYTQVQEWIEEGNTPEEAFSQEEIDTYNEGIIKQIQNSMILEGEALINKNERRISVGSKPLIGDIAEFNNWMKKNYDEVDANGISIFKPPPTERQNLHIAYEKSYSYTMTRYHDNLGYRWYMEMVKNTVGINIVIYDEHGNYLYTPNKMINTNNIALTGCPEAEASLTKEDIYFKFILASGNISGLQVYNKVDEIKKDIVRCDERYD